MKTGISKLRMAMAAACALGLGASASRGAAIPEPDTVLYGRVLNHDHGYELLVTGGELVWTLHPEANSAKTIELRATLEALPGGLSYRVKVPHEALSSGILAADVSANVVPLRTGDDRQQSSHVTIDGVPARILSPAGELFDVSQSRRSAARRVDLEVVLPVVDSDGDGLPDWWERKYGLDPFAKDATGDLDGDGLNNLKEFLGGSDPTQSDSIPHLVWSNGTMDEGSTETLSLIAADSDTPVSKIVYTLLEAPAGAQLRVLFGSAAPGQDGRYADRIVGVGDSFTQAQVNNGEVVLQHVDPSVTAVSLRFRLSDGDPGHAADVTAAVAVRPPTATDGTGAVVWFDARRDALESGGDSLTQLKDRSGAKPWVDGTLAPFDGQTADMPLPVQPAGPLGQRVVAFNLDPVGNAPQYLALPDATVASVFPSGDRTVLAVLKSIGDGSFREQVVNGADFQMALTGPGDHGRDSQVRYAVSGGRGVVYGNRDIRDQWAVISVTEDSVGANVDLNGSRVGGPVPLADPTALGTDAIVGARRVSGFDAIGQREVRSVDELFQGYMGELLVFNRALSSAEQLRIQYAWLSKWFGWVLMDGSDEARNLEWSAVSASLSAADYQSKFIPRNGPDHRYILLGGSGNDTLRGGHNDDILSAGIGTNLFTGGRGRDRFVFSAREPGVGLDTITDFRPAADRDAIDVASLLRGASRELRDYLRLRTDGHHSYLEIDFDGNRQYTDHTIVLQNTVLRDDQLYELWANTNLITGDKRFSLPVSVAVSTPTATEITGAAAQFTIHFEGSRVPDELEIPFEITGTAERGSDYRLSARRYHADSDSYAWEPISGNEFVIDLKPGDFDYLVRVEPVLDSHTEEPETVRLKLNPVPEYYDLTVADATVQIVDGPQRVSVVAWDDRASEDGDAGAFRLRREGGTDRALDVRIQMTGPAENGRDYGFIGSTVHFEAGQTQVTVPVVPRADELREQSEAVELAVIAGEGYIVSPAAQTATVIIDDSGPVVSIETVEPVAVLQDATKGAVLLRRRGLLQDSLTVLLDFGGSAGMGRDYRRLDRFVTFAAGASSVLLSIEPLAGAQMSVPVETVEVTVKPDASYTVAGSATAQVRLVATTVDFGRWRSAHFPGDATPLPAFGALDSDADGVPNLLEYAFGTDPSKTDDEAVAQPRAVVVNGRLGIRFQRPVAALDVEYVVEVSSDFRTWQVATAEFEEVAGTLASPAAEEVTLVERRGVGELGARFVRIRVELH